MGSRKPQGPRDLCAYFADIKESDGVISVPEEVTFLVKRCILDKIFSENPDIISVCRSDETSNVKFGPVNLEALRKGLEMLAETRSCSDNGGGTGNPISSLEDVVNAVIAGAEEDTYDEKKIIYFSNLSSYVLDEKEMVKLAKKLLDNDVFLSVILPRKADMTDIQIQNSKLLKSVLNRDEYRDVSFITNMENARKQILNTQSKKAKRPSPWNVLLEISPEIVINVGGYPCIRKNKSSDLSLTRVLVTESESKSAVNNSSTISTLTSDEQVSTAASSDSGYTSLNQSDTATVGQKTVVVEAAKEVVEKEQIWKQNDGSSVEQEDMGRAYYFGDKLIPYNELEHEGSYQSGGKCLKLIAFCSAEKIDPPFLTGDGITLFYSKKGDIESEVKFKALMSAMLNTGKVAIVRKVYQKNARVSIGTLVPEEERQCLIFTEICFADDVSIPQFPYLIKPEEMDEDNVELNEKEALIDELIGIKSLDVFNPRDGPCDPSVKIFREKAIQKVLKDSVQDAECKNTDSIDAFFRGKFDDDEINTLSEKIRDSFPLKENKVEIERLAGKNIFRKRDRDEEPELDTIKKSKLEDETTKDDTKVEVDENPDDFDVLFDEL